MQNQLTTASSQTEPSPKRRWNWGWGVATVYTLFALATLAFAAYSFTQKVELVSADYYSKGNDFDQHAGRVRNSQALAKPVQQSYDASKRVLTLRFPQAVSKGSVLLYRPSESGLDQTFVLHCDSNNEMIIPTSSLIQGHWRVQIEWESEGKSFYDEFSQVL